MPAAFICPPPSTAARSEALPPRVRRGCNGCNGSNRCNGEALPPRVVRRCPRAAVLAARFWRWVRRGRLPVRRRVRCNGRSVRRNRRRGGVPMRFCRRSGHCHHASSWQSSIRAIQRIPRSLGRHHASSWQSSIRAIQRIPRSLGWCHRAQEWSTHARKRRLVRV